MSKFLQCHTPIKYLSLAVQRHGYRGTYMDPTSLLGMGHWTNQIWWWKKPYYLLLDIYPNIMASLFINSLKSVSFASFERSALHLLPNITELWAPVYFYYRKWGFNRYSETIYPKSSNTKMMCKMINAIPLRIENSA